VPLAFFGRASAGILAMEDGFNFLLEDGSLIVLE